MKNNSIVLVIVVFLIALAGCQGKAPVNQIAKNGNGTPAVNVQGDKVLPATSSKAGSQSESTAEGAEGYASVSEDVSSAGAQAEITAGNAGDGMINSGDVIEIKEKMFVAQTNEIYVNAADYLGKKIKYEGVFQSYTLEEDDVTYYSVIRYGPGCCGTDANCGFEVKWADGRTEYPNQDDWAECEGVLEEYEEDGYNYLRLSLISLTAKDTRGAEYVAQ